ncbi:ATP-dependent sacrificial sulfur transferase LarE [Aeoliella sp. SH292]|uniref:ATP-dependent sacrificial sulfur transferase LarE n=1 Tax=Aeoliella sp. SH292 TaxID=3454464 RepID=UPI003F9D1E46
MKSTLTTSCLADELVACVAQFESCVVAYSGGVDSAVVAKAAHLALGDRAVAATGVGAAIPDSELDIARRVAADIGVRHVELSTSEIEVAEYVANAPDRCFHCKSELYRVLARYAANEGFATIANGTIVDDLGDYRPGLVAADNARVRSPLAECKFDKVAVRRLAEHWQLEVWDKPAAPCLASRIAYGEQVTPERLKRVDLAEQLLRSLGIRECRVRHHAGDLARIEVPLDVLPVVTEPAVLEWLTQEFTQLGFRYVTLDLAGFRSGSLNVGLPVLQ